jgi:DNA-binding XRE family transcriptional regulator
MNTINFYRSPDFRTSVIQIKSDVGFITIRIEGKWNPKQRRALGRSIFAQLKPVLGYLRRICLHHLEHWPFDYNRAELRGMNTFKQSDFQSENAKFGLSLRMARLQKGITLRELSQKIGLSRTQLSGIERGLHTPQPSTYKKITEFFNS